MPNAVDQSAWWNPLLTSAILVATYITNDYSFKKRHIQIKIYCINTI